MKIKIGLHANKVKKKFYIRFRINYGYLKLFRLLFLDRIIFFSTNDIMHKFQGSQTFFLETKFLKASFEAKEGFSDETVLFNIKNVKIEKFLFKKLFVLKAFLALKNDFKTFCLREKRLRAKFQKKNSLN